MSDMRTTWNEGHLADYDGTSVCCISAERSSLDAAILERSNVVRYCFSQAEQKLRKRLDFVTDESCKVKPRRCVNSGCCNSLLFSTDKYGGLVVSFPTTAHDCYDTAEESLESTELVRP